MYIAAIFCCSFSLIFYYFSEVGKKGSIEATTRIIYTNVTDVERMKNCRYVHNNFKADQFTGYKVKSIVNLGKLRVFK